MKKYICISIMLGILSALIFISYSFSDIKTVHSSNLKQTEYSEKLNVSGEFESRDKTYIYLSYPVCKAKFICKQGTGTVFYRQRKNVFCFKWQLPGRSV